jgi:MFS family permease
MWAVPVLVFVLLLAAVAARGLMPFGAGPYPGDSAVDPEAAQATYAEAERSRWLLSLVVFGSVFGFLLAILPRSLRRTLSEPEPMDAAGSAELAELYARQRRKRVLGLFWGLGTLAPLFMGSFTALQVWYPQDGSVWGLVGVVGGSILGVCGAVFGTWMTAERARIAEVRMRLEQSRAASAA